MKTLSTHSKQSVTAGRELHRVATLEQRVGKENTIKKRSECDYNGNNNGARDNNNSIS